MKRLHDKLYNWEAAPPAHSWDRISHALDESELQADFPSRLRDLDAVPPADAWSRIAANLEAAPAAGVSEGAVVVPIKRRWNVWMRYAAALLILLAAGWGLREMLNKSAELSSAEPVAIQASEGKAAAPTNDLPQPGPHVTDPDSAKALESDKEESGLRSAGNRMAQFASDAPGGMAENDDPAIYVYEDRRPRMASNYMTLLTADGSVIRLSRKWSNLLCCIAGEDEDAGCQEQLKTWQDQLASSPVAPGPGSFLDIVDLVNSLSSGARL
ncbi:MAG: hypothetical protein ACK4E0_13070 [Chitinophagaceae bacterium]